MKKTNLQLKQLFVVAACLIVLLSFGKSESSRGAEAKPILVTLQTNQGDITLELSKDKAPATVANFLAYAKEGFYNGTIFHRVINGFMIQGGGMDANLQAKPTRPPVKNEADNGLSNAPYTVAMARTGDPHSATAQFFINVADNSKLNYSAPNPPGWGYAVFGKVVKGQEVVDKIKAVPTTTRGLYENVPVEPIIINKAVIVQQ
jgi:peptidyl-prolyl cis-trans isomerase B (cyclophilin B)